MQKAKWNKPVLIVHGDVEEITQQSNLNNADSPAGIANTAFSVHPGAV